MMVKFLVQLYNKHFSSRWMEYLTATIRKKIGSLLGNFPWTLGYPRFFFLAEGLQLQEVIEKSVSVQVLLIHF